MNKIDLHMHTIISDDGEFTPEEIATMCAQKELEYIAIADHNSVAAVLQLLQKKELPIKLIPAIEIDCRFQGKDFHLLGYGINPKDSSFSEIEHHIESQEVDATKKRLAHTKDVLNFIYRDEDIERLSRNNTISAEGIMEACMLVEENNQNPNMLPYLEGGNRSDNPYVNYYWDHFGQGKPGYVPMEFPTMEAMIKLIHEQGGIAVLAHPGNNVKEDMQLLEDIIALHIDGIEVYSSYHTPEQVQIYHDAATNHELILTCGSDFHGKTKPAIALGDHTMPDVEQNNLIEQLKKLSA